MSSGNIASKSDSIKGDEIADKEENAGQNEFNDDENSEEGQLQDIDTTPDSAYRTENDTDTLQERSESTALDDTEKDPDFDVEKEEQKNSEVTIIADETNQDEEGDNAEVTPMVPKKRRKKSPQKTFVNKKPGAKKGKGNDEDEEDDFYYHCDKCSQKFTDWKKLRKHKLDCVKVPRKFTCSKCNRGFQQKQSWNSILIFTTRKNPRSMFAMNTTNAMCTRNHMMNTSEEITLVAITDLCVTIVVRDSSTKVNSVSTGTLFI